MMPVPNDDNHVDGDPQTISGHRDHVPVRGVIQVGRFVADPYDELKRESPKLFRRVQSKSCRTSGDLDGLIEDLGRAVRDQDSETRASAARMLRRFGEAVCAYSGDTEAARNSAVWALIAA